MLFHYLLTVFAAQNTLYLAQESKKGCAMSPVFRILLRVSFVFMGSTPLWAESDRLQPDFTFRSVKPPPPGFKGPRITVQIEPEAPTVETPADPAAPAPASGTEWFWEAVSPNISEDPAARIQQALRTMDGAPQASSVPSPRLQQLQGVAAAHSRALLVNSINTNVSPALALAVISVESGGRADAQSHAGAQGLMQLMPATAERFGVQNSLDPNDNIRGGMEYLSWLIKEFDGDVILALAGYNAGEGAVRQHGGVPPYAETRAYIPKVLAAWKVARGLCKTPPELMSDGCVFITG